MPFDMFLISVIAWPGILLDQWDGQLQLDRGSITSLAFHNASPADVLQPAFHIGQAIPGGCRGRLETAAIILNGNPQRPSFKSDFEDNFRSLGMFEHIMHRFLDRHHDVVPRLA